MPVHDWFRAYLSSFVVWQKHSSDAIDSRHAGPGGVRGGCHREPPLANMAQQVRPTALRTRRLLALAIRNYFQSGTTLHHPVPRNTDYPATMHMVCPQRMPVHQLLLNRHQSWKWFRREGLSFMARKLALKLFAVLPTSRRVFPDRVLH